MFKDVLCCIVIFLVCINIFADGTEPNGSGTETDPYQVETLDNLLWISTNSISWDKHFIQIDDVNASDTQNWNNGEGFSPIGTYLSSNRNDPFLGFYDGQEHTISDLYINRQYPNIQGFFGYTTGAIIENLGLVNVDVNGFDLVGGLIGYSDDSVINNCYSTGIVEGVSRVGGLIGRDYHSTVSNCYSLCNINGLTFGGLIGDIESTSLNNSFYNFDEVLINGENVITVGALDSEKFEVWMDNGLVLNIDNYLISNGENYLISSVEDLKTLLAFGQSAGYSFLLQTDLDLYNEVNFYLPYFCGEFNGNGYNIENLNINRSSNSNIGLFGYINEAQIENLSATNINVIGGNRVGGLVGNCYISSISNCFTSGIIEGFSSVGGLVGRSRYNCIIANCYSTSTVNGYNHVGGLIGSLFIDCIINKCYSTGSVSGNIRIGGLVGDNLASIINDSFWDVEVSGQSISEGGTGKTTLEMKEVATYTDTSIVGLNNPWDFVDNPFNDIGNNDYWDIDNVTNNGYPFLTTTPVVGINDEVITELFGVYKLIGNYPNPFNPTTTIDFSIQNNSKIELSIYNIKGQKIKSLISDQIVAGEHSIVWKGEDASGRKVGSGVYLYKLIVNGKTEAVKKCLLLK